MKHDILSLTTESENLEIQNSKIISRRFKNITKKGVRIFKDNQLYSSSFVGNISDEELLTQAENTLIVGMPYDYDIPQRTPLKMAIEASKHSLISQVEESLDLLAPLKKQFVFSGQFETTRQHTKLEDSCNVIQECELTTTNWHYRFNTIGSPNIIDGYFEENEVHKLDVLQVIQRVIPFLKNYTKEISLTAGRYPICFVETDMLLSKTSESLLADKYYQGGTLYSNKLGAKIFSDSFSLYDCRINETKGLLKPFDLEGTIRAGNELYLIRNGVFCNTATDLKNAKKYNIAPTGNGLRTYVSSVAPYFNKLTLQGGKRTLDEIFQSLDECIVAFMANGGDFTDKGEFSTPLQLAFLIRRGEIVGRLPQLMVKTTNDEMFGSRLIEIASEGLFQNHYNPCFISEMDVMIN